MPQSVSLSTTLPCLSANPSNWLAQLVIMIKNGMDCSSEIEGIKLIMEKLKSVVPFKTGGTAASSPAPKAAKLSATELKELSFVLNSKGADQDLPSGYWKGYFIDKRALKEVSSGSKWLINVNMTFQNRNQFTARGNDDVGPFIFKNGKISGGSKVKFVKQYATHQVFYEGEVLGVQMIGIWWLQDAPSIKGQWAMWPVS
ncbi:hypothetical protein OS493_025585 [Desmophyllum pertusum]|uniref:Uncharacterized protein n=1 Tax=Desmophyllum pertusum TaxID=174260 RepID=A0A9X0A003_9CNID|nr:hypothetical protein OS493_025585 [Desmophyllum pertusum]